MGGILTAQCVVCFLLTCHSVSLRVITLNFDSFVCSCMSALGWAFDELSHGFYFFIVGM